MTNNEIITKSAIAAGLITEEQAVEFMKAGRRIPLHTYQEWRRLGYQVKQNEHAALVVYLWRFSSKAKTDDGKEEETQEEHAYQAKAHLFTASQVEKATTHTVRTKEEIAAYNAMLAEQRRARRASQAEQVETTPEPEQKKEKPAEQAGTGKIKKATFYSRTNCNGGVTKWEGFTDGKFNYYKEPKSKDWYAILPDVGLSVAKERTRRDAIASAHSPSLLEKIDKFLSKDYNTLASKFDELVKTAEAAA